MSGTDKKHLQQYVTGGILLGVMVDIRGPETTARE